MKDENYIKKVKEFQEECLKITKKKTKVYGASSIGELGIRGEFLGIHRKYIRLKELIWNLNPEDSKETNDTLKDTLIDMANYCAMIYSLMEEENA